MLVPSFYADLHCPEHDDRQTCSSDAHGVIGHDMVIKDYVTLCPSCTVSGYVVIEEEVFVVAGSTIVNGRVGSVIRNALTRTAGALGRDHLQFE